MNFYKPKNVGIASHPHSSSRGTRFQRRDSIDEINVDFTKDPKSVVGEILLNISKKEGITKGRKLSFLNAFVKYLQIIRGSNSNDGDTKKSDIFGFSTEDIILCLRVCLVHEASVIRLAALRVLRHLIVCEEDLITMNAIQIPFLIVRSLDIVLNNSAERLQATRLCQRILAIPNGAKHFPCSVTRALVAIGFDGHQEHDKLYRGSLSLLCQLSLLNPVQFIECGGVRVLLHNMLCCTSPMVLEAMIGSLLHLLNVPETRDAAGVNLQSLVAPFTDVHFKHGANESSDKDLDEREVGYQCAKIAIGTVLRSWSGIAHFCQSKNSGLQALIDALYIEQLEIRRTILDLICEILGVKFPTWTDEVTVALSAVDPSYPQDSWKLQEGFIVEEALSILPHPAVSRPNITANHMALIVLSFIRGGLLEALVEVIVTGDTFISVRGTVLLGELLSLVDKYIPLDCYDPSQCIPTLIRYSSGGISSTSSPSKAEPQSQSAFIPSVTPQSRQQRAMEAISVLSSLQKIKARTPSPSSLFLQAQLEYAGYVPKQPGKFSNKLGLVQVSRLLKRDIEGNPAKLLKDSGVLNSKDSTTWQWDIIHSLIKWTPLVLKRVDDSSWRNFLKRLIDYFKPSSNMFSKLEIGKEQSKQLSRAACNLVQFLAEDVENFSGSVLLEELLVDIASHLDELLRQPTNPGVCFFSPIKLESTLSQIYFLLIGKLSHSVKGYQVLEKGDILSRFYSIVCNVQHESYIKLIISSLSYREEYCKRILSAALTCSFDGSRLYATKFLRILVRSKLVNFSKWGMELLVNQLPDPNPTISLAAIDILEEAIHDKMFLESLIALRPTLTHVGDRGLLLLICFLSLPSGFKFLLEANFLKNEIRKWKTSFNKRYVELVEVLVRDSVSTLRRGEDGKYPERASRNQEQCKFIDIYVLPHLYGQLAQHKDGLEMLLASGDIDALIQVVTAKNCKTPEETRELKAALWAMAHFATSVDAVQIIEDSRVLETMVDLGRMCPVLSVRHTIFHCLCLICTTVPGTEALRKYGWHGMPRNHHENYTIWTPEYYANETRRMLRLRLETEMEFQEDLEDAEKASLADTCSNMLIEDDSEFLLMEPDLMKQSPNFGMLDQLDEEYIQSSSHPKAKFVSDVLEPLPMSSASSSRKQWSHEHHRSQSDSLALGFPSTVNKINGENPLFNESDTVDGAARFSADRVTSIIIKRNEETISRESVPSILSGSAPNPRSGSDGSWRWRKSRSDSVSNSTTSGVSSCDSTSFVIAGRSIGNQPSAEHVQTLSPIPSSASIATTIYSNTQLTEQQSPPSRGSSRGTLTEPALIGRFGAFGSPSHAYRSVKIRKPIIRMPILSDSEIYPNFFYGSSSGRRGSNAFRDPRTSSLDRHLVLSAGDLFGESKLMRVGSSVTSLSTPSFRIRPESETKGPCYMGLCVPEDFQAIFLTDSSIPLHVRMTSGQGDIIQSEEPLKMGDSFEFHHHLQCMGCYRVKEDDSDNEALNDSLNVDFNEPITENTVQPPSFVSVSSIIRGDMISVNERKYIHPNSPEGKNAIRKEVLKLVSNLICCVGAKANEQGLLRLKQKFPLAFKDLCLYNELCSLMSKYNLRLPLRRFLQEVFYDHPFEEFFKVSEEILKNKDAETVEDQNEELSEVDTAGSERSAEQIELNQPSTTLKLDTEPLESSLNELDSLNYKENMF